MGTMPDWCEPLPDAETMRQIDRWSIERRGVASLELMERAGLELARVAASVVGDGAVLVMIGKGNNGGDGLVAARILRDEGRQVRLVATAPLDEISGDAAVNLERLGGGRPLVLTAAGEHAAELERAALIIDALLGTGFQGKPCGAVAHAIDQINQAGCPVVSADVPSGVDASTGVVAGNAVRAHATVTFHAAKPGLWVNPGKSHAGKVHVVDIGIPRGAPLLADIGLITSRVAERLPVRDAQATKFTSGHVVVAGGSRGLMGAPAITSLAAMRAGAGYVTACVPGSQAHVIDVQLMEVMTRALDERDGAVTVEAVPVVLDALERAGTLALGPGLGRSDGAFAFARELARRSQAPTVIDADALNAHAALLDDLAQRSGETVLTPHAGELARLLELTSEQVERERVEHVRRASRSANAVVVLKGDDTLIADPEGRVAVSAGASPGLATAGSGDALTGVIAALLAKSLDAFTAACAGVWLHAAAGRRAAAACGTAEGVIASDVVAQLPAARAGEGSR
jgi:ADP-dependent NAD(P)H-hydrate dehydratase / NAD(P)H-hydrate epimerase